MQMVPAPAKVQIILRMKKVKWPKELAIISIEPSRLGVGILLTHFAINLEAALSRSQASFLEAAPMQASSPSQARAAAAAAVLSSRTCCISPSIMCFLFVN